MRARAGMFQAILQKPESSFFLYKSNIYPGHPGQKKK
jgi:hypothetical protein